MRAFSKEVRRNELIKIKIYFRHLAEDLTGMHVKHKDVSEMSDDEKSFYYFKIHDTDNNNNLDGLEMIKAALHRHGESNSQDELSHITSKLIILFFGADLD